MRDWIELAAQGIEALAVAIMVAFTAVGTARWLFHSGKGIAGAYEKYRLVLGKSLLLGLELLVAADIIRTVALDASLMNLATLAVLVALRTFLGWTITLEVEGRWPWQSAKGAGPGGEETPGRTPEAKGAPPARGGTRAGAGGGN
jgi:uncharacterized membrane protein